MDSTGTQAGEATLSTSWKAGRDAVFSDAHRRRRLRLIVLSWLGGALILSAYGTLRVYFGKSDSPVATDLPALGRNETGAFVGWRQGPWAVHGPTYRVAFDNLRAENAGLGPFRTASHKIIRIDNLEVTFLPSRRRSGAVSAALTQFRDLLAPPQGGDSYDGLAGLFAAFPGEAADWAVSLDLSNTAEVQIRPMDWRICHGGETVFRVRCRYARLAAGASSIVLRGHATVTANGATLESNCIRIDARNRQFVVDGRYLLTRGKDRRTGADACFNADLEFAGTKS